MTDLSAQLSATSRPLRTSAVLNRAEIVLIALLFGTGVLCLVVSAVKSQAVAWSGFGLGYAACAGLFAVGLFIRLKKDQPNIAHLAIGNSLYLGFTATATLLIYLRFPVVGPLLDDHLIAFDRRFGYVWPDVVQWMAGYPVLGQALHYVYMSSLAQLFVLVTVLALSGRVLQLHRALLAGCVSLLLTTLVWWIAPSVGPAAFFEIPLETAEAINLFTDMQYGAYLRELVANGLPEIAPHHIVGTIAFPSFHTVMALLVVWYFRGTALFWPALLLNSAMVPAIMVHGGHYLTDMFGGVLTFAIAAIIAAKVLDGSAASQEG